MNKLEGEGENLLVSLARIEGKIDRMNDKVKLTEERVEALLDVVTGSRSGGATGLVVRVHTLESKIGGIENTLAELNGINGRIDDLSAKLDAVLRMQNDHPPLLYLLRFQTRRTVFWLVLAFILLSLWWVSGFRHPILELLGLPLF